MAVVPIDEHLPAHDAFADDAIERHTSLDRRRMAPATTVLIVAAIVAALVAMFGETDSFTLLTAFAAVLGLVPWAMSAVGTRISPWVFAVLGMIPALIMVAVDHNPGGMFPAMLVIVAVVRSSASRATVVGSVIASLAAIAALAVDAQTAYEHGLIYFAAGVGIAWLVGEMLRRQERLTRRLVELHARDIQHAATEERSRIAREVHDVVAHSLTVVMLHVTGARRLLHVDPERAHEALMRVEDVGRDSLDSIRGIVGLLRAPDREGDDGNRPLPGIDELPVLVDRYRSTGVTVDARISVTAAAADASTGLAVYRVVQESLTNAARHAPGTRCAVDVRLIDDNLIEVRVVNGARASTTMPDVAADTSNAPWGGHGLRGLDERVRALGGRMDAGRTPNGGWHVAVRIPVRRTHIGDATAATCRSAAGPVEGPWAASTPAT